MGEEKQKRPTRASVNGKHFQEGEEKKHLTTRESYKEKKKSFEKIKSTEIITGGTQKEKKNTPKKREAWEKGEGCVG